MGLAKGFIWLAVSSVILAACGSTGGDGGGGTGATAGTSGAGGGSSGGSAGGAGKPSGGSSSMAGASAGTTSNPGVNACDGFPSDCILLCQGGLCDCYCEQGPACTEPPPTAACENCYFDTDCPDGQRCYGAECGQSATAPALGDCRTLPEPGGCWGDEDCNGPLICDGASVCPCGAACLVEDMPGTCVRP